MFCRIVLLLKWMRERWLQKLYHVSFLRTWQNSFLSKMPNIENILLIILLKYIIKSLCPITVLMTLLWVKPKDLFIIYCFKNFLSKFSEITSMCPRGQIILYMYFIYKQPYHYLAKYFSLLCLCCSELGGLWKGTSCGNVVITTWTDISMNKGLKQSVYNKWWPSAVWQACFRW